VRSNARSGEKKRGPTYLLALYLFTSCSTNASTAHKRVIESSRQGVDLPAIDSGIAIITEPKAATTGERTPAPTDGSADSSADGNASASKRLPMLTGEWLLPLRGDDGANLGSIAPAIGASEPRPLIVGLHAALSRPDWLCSALRATAGPGPIIVCPHSAKDSSTVASWASGLELRERTLAALAAAFRDYAQYIDREKMMVFAHSQGGMFLPNAFGYAYRNAPKLPWKFRTLVLFEALPRQLDGVPLALRELGAERVLLVSGQSGWATGHKELRDMLKKQNTSATYIQGKFGHFFNDESTKLLHPVMQELLK
jgi:hypothetical protein